MLLLLLACSPAYEEELACNYVAGTEGPFTAEDVDAAFGGSWSGTIAWACDVVNCSSDANDTFNVELASIGTGEDWLLAEGDAECKSSVDASWSLVATDGRGWTNATATSVTGSCWGASEPTHMAASVPAAVSAEVFADATLLVLWLDSSNPSAALVRDDDPAVILARVALTRR